MYGFPFPLFNNTAFELAFLESINSLHSLEWCSDSNTSKRPSNIAAITHIILYRKIILKTCVSVSKLSAVDFLSATYSIVLMLKIRAPIFSWLKPSLLPNHSNHFDLMVEGHQLFEEHQLMNVALYHLTLRQCLQNSLMFERNLSNLLSSYHYLALKQRRRRRGNWNVFVRMSDRTWCWRAAWLHNLSRNLCKAKVTVISMISRLPPYHWPSKWHAFSFSIQP